LLAYHQLSLSRLSPISVALDAKSSPGSQRRRGGVSSVQDALGAFLRESGLAPRVAQSVAQASIFRAWNEALGEALARHAQPVRLQDGELLVEVQSAPHLHELANFTGEKFRHAANARLGRERIRSVTFQLKR
jgi:predicted nucleic acid-binding Zn ribbon protein